MPPVEQNPSLSQPAGRHTHVPSPAFTSVPPFLSSLKQSTLHNLKAHLAQHAAKVQDIKSITRQTQTCAHSIPYPATLTRSSMPPMARNVSFSSVATTSMPLLFSSSAPQEVPSAWGVGLRHRGVFSGGDGLMSLLLSRCVPGGKSWTEQRIRTHSSRLPVRHHPARTPWQGGPPRHAPRQFHQPTPKGHNLGVIFLYVFPRAPADGHKSILSKLLLPGHTQAHVPCSCTITNGQCPWVFCMASWDDRSRAHST